MGRGRGKGKKVIAVSSHEDPDSGVEDTVPAYKRKGRPQKPTKDQTGEDEVVKVEEEEEGIERDDKSNVTKSPASAESEKKRKRFPQIKGNVDLKAEENGGPISGIEDSVKVNGFRLNGSRRKSKPRRAAEAIVECK